ncbi:hypothetical protein [Streptomyces sp. AK02-01A]|uniref:hypothetical protein n=1 Tax=Streptomyces sp. AK02-01A TaxID=3028648 RepID=UPI0029AADACF|nr:hypothetical protein [Streptomyces sp. AK02-01A]MDX3851708.1 hypothetical protein [Streptomyces sp. AK02-01A]
MKVELDLQVSELIMFSSSPMALAGDVTAIDMAMAPVAAMAILENLMCLHPLGRFTAD